MSDRDWLARLLLPRRLLLNSVNLAESRRHHLGLTGALSGTANWHRWRKDTISFVHEESSTVEPSEVELKVLLLDVLLLEVTTGTTPYLGGVMNLRLMFQRPNFIKSNCASAAVMTSHTTGPRLAVLPLQYHSLSARI